MVLLLPFHEENQDWGMDKWEQGLLLPFLPHSPGRSASSLCLPPAPPEVPVPLCLSSSTASGRVGKQNTRGVCFLHCKHLLTFLHFTFAVSEA